MTRQEILDKVCERAKDKRKALANRRPDDTLCAYRTKDGLRCFVGALIPDEMYSPELEGQAACSLPLKFADYFGANNMPFLDDLQQVHDQWEPHEWEARLRFIAKDYGLEYRG